MDDTPEAFLALARSGARLSDAQIRSIAAGAPADALLACARALTLEGHGRLVGHSRKVFIPVTRLCRNVCGYCTFATSPRAVPSAFLSREEVLQVARAGAAAGCREALFTLGEKPELRYRAARDALQALGHASTIDYVAELAECVFQETGLLPHVNAGNLSAAEIARLRPHAASMGIMLETAASRLGERGQAHWNCPDKAPDARLATLAAAGEAGVAMTSGILIGIGETPMERVEALLALRALHEGHGNLQEIIVQNFCAKPRTPMANAAEPTLAEHTWAIAMARLVFGARMSIQAPPNLRAGELQALLDAGVNDWGGISPVTIDHVNPEAAWPKLERLAIETAACERRLVERLALVPAFAREAGRWSTGGIRQAVLRAIDADGWVREGRWLAGAGMMPDGDHAPLVLAAANVRARAEIAAILARAEAGRTPGEEEIAKLFSARGADFAAIVHAADALRRRLAGDSVSYVRNCNLNYTNICLHRCGFCAFAKSHAASTLRGPAYLLDAGEVARRAHEAWSQGAREICMQGGIHPDYDGNTYLALVRAVKNAAPDMHIHAFSPLEILHGTRTLGLSVTDYVLRLRDAGLGSLPGTAAEILDDEVRAILCPDKLNTAEWLEVMRSAHRAGIRSTATIMFGHVDTPRHWARHLLRIRSLQAETGGFTEFVPLPFVHMESPCWHKGQARTGPTLREAILMHAVPRLVFGELITNIQASWVKMGREGAALCLRAGANDLGGTLMYESITRAAGGANGQRMDDEDMRSIAAAACRPLHRRTTLYQPAAGERGPTQATAALAVAGCSTAADMDAAGLRPPNAPGGPGVQAILLAAGLGRRFDPSGRRDKLLQDLGDGRTVLWHSASKLRTALGSCMAVIRPGQHERRRILEDAGCRVIESEAAREGMGAALAAAVQASATAGGWLVALADMPWLAPELIRRVAAAIDTSDAVAAPWCDGRRGHPVAFGAAWRQRLAALEGDQGARELLARAAVRRIEPAPRAVLHDVDVPADLGAALGGERVRRTDRS